MQFIVSARMLRFVDIRSLSDEEQNFRIDIQYNMDRIVGNIDVIATSTDTIIWREDFDRNESTNKLFIFHNQQERNHYKKLQNGQLAQWRAF